MNKKTLFFLGHSLIEFYDWQKRFSVHEVFSLGRAGETVEGLLGRLGGIIDRYPTPDIVFIMTGINNVAMEDTGFFPAYRKIILILREAYPDARIYVHSLSPVLMEFISDSVVRDVNKSLMRMVREMGTDYIDLYGLFMKEGVENMLLPDGVHLTDAGYRVWSQAIEPLINEG